MTTRTKTACLMCRQLEHLIDSLRWHNGNDVIDLLKKAESAIYRGDYAAAVEPLNHAADKMNSDDNMRFHCTGTLRRYARELDALANN